MSNSNVSSNETLGNLEATLTAARASQLPTFMSSLTAWMRLRKVNFPYVDGKQKIIHKGVIKHARSAAFAFSSGL